MSAATKKRRAVAPGKRRAPAPGGSRKRSPAKEGDTAESTFSAVARQLGGWTDSVAEMASLAADVSLGVAKAILPASGARTALAKAGAALRSMREAAGYSIDELGRAVNLDDPVLLELVEHGKIALPFEIVLRLASVLGRNDPIAFVMNMTRSTHPGIWRALEDLGIGRLAVQAGREREVANVYRANDAARGLTDGQFARVLDFTRTAFDMAVDFAASPGTAKDRAAPRPDAGRKRGAR